MRVFLRTTAYLTLVATSFNDLGHLSADLNRFLSLVALALLLSVILRPGPLERPALRTALGALICLAAAGIFARLVPAGIASFHLLVFSAALFLVPRSPSPVGVDLRTHAMAFALVVLLAELNRLLPFVWHIKQASAALLSSASAKVVGEPRNLGPTAMGIPLLGALVLLALVSEAARPREARRPRVLVAAIPFLAHFVYLLFLTPLARWIAAENPGWTRWLLNSQWLFILLGSGIFTLFTKLAPRSHEHANAPSTPPAGLRSARPRLLAGLAVGVAFTWMVSGSEKRSHEPVSILIYEEGYGTWAVPEHGFYGEKSGGMFGVLPEFLRASGFEVERSEDLAQLEAPEHPDCLVLINIQRYLEDPDKERIARFVADGGGLLCLGDHTGVAGIRGPFNDLLAPHGIRFRFDSASFFGGSWAHALEIRRHPLNHRERSEEDYQLWVGASLDLDPPAFPVVVAKYGYSDFGNMSNVERAYLGDRLYNAGELLGDVVLVGETRVGKGKILAFGDTSGYQNLSLPRSCEFVRESLRYLGTSNSALPSVRRQVVALVVFFLVLAAMTKGFSDGGPAIAALAGMLATSAVLAAFERPETAAPPDWRKVWSARASGDPQEVHFDRDLAVVDRSHGGRFDLRAWYDNSIGGLLLNLMRNGFFPVVTERFPVDELARADLLVLLSPMRGYSGSERREIRRFIERGGRLLVSVGYEEFDGSRGLLDDYGFSVLGVPLAHFRTGEAREDLVFQEAWALAPPKEATTIVTQWDEPVVAKRRIGKGEVIVIADSYFFLNRNLEGRERHFLGNIEFFRRLSRGEDLAPIHGKFGVSMQASNPILEAVSAPEDRG
jgi:hypothetical protein